MELFYHSHALFQKCFNYTHWRATPAWSSATQHNSPALDAWFYYRIHTHPHTITTDYGYVTMEMQAIKLPSIDQYTGQQPIYQSHFNSPHWLNLHSSFQHLLSSASRGQIVTEKSSTANYRSIDSFTINTWSQHIQFSTGHNDIATEFIRRVKSVSWLCCSLWRVELIQRKSGRTWSKNLSNRILPWWLN